ncbi:MAG: phosphoribosylformylglycinamidine cyclo-ligase [Candidatus Dormibacteraeota bacterium]|nr:phosphoribosylformylglycinamidine cyclo-ligase [Candidatus Dormibacteraeota bacterium]
MSAPPIPPEGGARLAGAYADAGVDIAGYGRLLERVRPMIVATHGPQVVNGIGPFAGLYRLPDGGGLLAASADGIGTKIKVAVAYERHTGIGHDLVNHCVNDIATTGARPLFFLDYFASGRLDGPVFEQVMTGLTAACAANGCPLLGGETAEMPGLYALGDYDVAGFAVGLVPAGTPPRSPVIAGDLIVGLASSGLHTNGFSLVRRVFQDQDLHAVLPGLDRPLGEELLEPHRSYLAPLSSLPWKAAAHITGGGLIENVPRALPAGLAAELEPAVWPVPPIFDLIQRRGRIDPDEMMGTFNMGLGLVLVTSDPIPGHPVVGRVVEAGAGPRLRFR